MTTIAVMSGPKLARHRNRDRGSYEIDRAKLAQLVRRLQRQNQPDEKCNERENRQRTYANIHGL